MRVTQVPRSVRRGCSTRLRVAIADECRLSREGLRALLSAFGSCQPRDALPTLDAVRATGAEVVLLDGRGGGALQLCRQLAASGERPWPIVFGLPAEQESTVRALEAGARGVLSLGAGARELRSALRAVHAGQLWAPGAAVVRVAQDLFWLTSGRSAGELPVERLSPREREVMRHAAAGLSNKEIAARIGASPATVKAHLSRVFEKLGVRDRIQLAARYRDEPPPVPRRPRPRPSA